jgi:multidrug efflux pump subunit AcrA (membrane-fusion protein)
MRLLLKVLSSCVPNVLVLGSLGLLAVYGHETDWTFLPSDYGKHHVQHHDDSAEAHHVHAAHHAVATGAEDTAVPTPAETASAAARAAGPIASAPPQDQIHVDSETQGDSFINVSPVMVRQMEEYVVAPGAMTYVRDGVAALAARVPGTVWRVEKRLGDTVRQGEILVILDACAVGDAKAAFLESLVSAELKQLTVHRLESAGEAVAAKQLAEARSALRQAIVTRFNAQQALINLGFSIRHEDFDGLSDIDRSSKIHFLGLPATLVDTLDPASTSANLIPVVAPFDGVVIKSDVVRGEVVSPERSELAIADINKMLLRLNINKEDALRVAVGQPIEYTADGILGTLNCKVNWISTELDDKTRTLQALAEVDNPVVDADGDGISHRLLKANTYGVGKIRVRSQPVAMAVPAMAVQWDGKKHLVFVEERAGDEDAAATTYSQRVVVPGTVDDGFVEIIKGVESGELVVVDGSHMLKSEMMTRRLTSNTP